METSLLSAYLLSQLRRAEVLLPQIGSGSDPENLHQYRVALRRSRSVMGIYLDENYALEAMLKPLLKSTNVLRETDVFLLGVDAKRYPSLLQELQEYHRALYLQVWNPETVRMHLNTLHRLLEDLAHLECGIPDNALAGIALERYAEAIALKKALNRHSSAKKIHKVRIRCKRARYALEFIQASGLKDVAKKIKKCKKILSHFGDIQDTANQLALLKHFCRSTPSEECSALFSERKKAFKALKEKL